MRESYRSATIREALRGNAVMHQLMVPSIEEDDVRAVAEVLQSGWSVQGALREKDVETAVGTYLRATALP